MYIHAYIHIYIWVYNTSHNFHKYFSIIYIIKNIDAICNNALYKLFKHYHAVVSICACVYVRIKYFI